MVLGAAWVCGSTTLRLLIHIPKDQEGERADSMQGWSINPQDHLNTFQSPSPSLFWQTHAYAYLPSHLLWVHWGASLCGIHMSQEVVSIQLGAHARRKPFVLLFFKPEFKGPDPPFIPLVTGKAMLSLIQLHMGTDSGPPSHCVQPSIPLSV